MSNQPVKKLELTAQQKWDNIQWSIPVLYTMIAAAWWYISLSWWTIQHKHRLPGKPVCIELWGSHPESALDILKQYNLRYSFGSIRWKIINNSAGLLLQFLVSKASFDYVDNVLSHYEDSTFNILTNPGTKRGQGLRKPYQQRTKTIRPKAKPITKQTKVGRTYEGGKR